MSDPLVPNFHPGVGRLTTDRFDFQKHLDGYPFRHNAGQIDLTPSVVIDGYYQHTVQQAIQAISTVAFPPIIPDATASVKGIIRLNGDLLGTATNPIVAGLRTYPVSAAAPVLGNVLTYDGSLWGPAAPVNNFTAGGDLSGTNSVQTVTQISGTGTTGNVTMNTREILFASGLNPVIITQDPPLSAAGNSFRIKAQDGNGLFHDGGGLDLRSGSPGIGGKRGYLSLSMDDSNSPMVQLIEPTLGNRVLGLCATTSITGAQMPAGTGDLVTYIANTVTPPTTNPSSGAILYATDGYLNIRQSDGLQFKVGSLPNPNTWGTTKEFVTTYREAQRRISPDYETPFIYSFTVPNNSTCRVDVIVVGREESPGALVYSSNMSATISWTGVAQSIIAPGLVITNEVNNTGADLVSSDITVSGSTISVKSGYVLSGGYYPINWLILIQVSCIVDA